MRKRNNPVMTRYSDEELKRLNGIVKAYGISLQSYINKTSLGVKIPTPEEAETLKDMNRLLADIDRQIRGLATNVNQMAHVANGQGFLPAERKLEALHGEVKAIRDMVNELWQSTRSLIGGQTRTQR